jgi:DNA gyrase/topoisomerase IV subunit A
MIQRRVRIAVLALFAAAGTASAHEHKVLGTATMMAPDHLMMKTTEGQVVTVKVSDATKVVKGKAGVKLETIKPGTRIVVTTESDEPPYTAMVIQVGAARTASTKTMKRQ